MFDVKIAVIGCGYWGKNLVRNFAELGTLAAVCDADNTLAQKASEQYGVPALSLEKILNSPVNGVVIAAPAALHYTLASQALKAGKHVFVEKPLALEVEQALELCDIAKEKDLQLMVGHLLQYHPAFTELKHMIDKGTLGRLQYISSNRLNLGKFRNEENILWSFAPHDISMILSMAGGVPESVYSTGMCHLNPQIHDVTVTHLSFQNGIQAHIYVSWLHPYKEQKLIVVGDKGMAVFDDSMEWDEKLRFYPHHVNWIDGFPQPEKADPINIPLDVSEPLKLECAHFINCIKNDQAPLTDGQEGLRVLRVLDAAQKSLQSKSPINLNRKTQSLYFRHESAVIDPGCTIGKGSKIWHFSHILKDSALGEDCVIGQNVTIGPDVRIGDRCKIQNNVSLYKGVTLEDGVFCGPSCVFTNVNNPRAEIERKQEFRQTLVAKGATIGANATIVCGVTLGAYSFIGAGAVVTKDVKPHALVVGNPARQVGWVSHSGEKLGDDLVCPRDGRRYELTADNTLVEERQAHAAKKQTA